MSELRAMQAVYNDHTTTLQQTLSTRWLSFRGAVGAIRKSYLPLLEVPGNLMEDGCASAGGLLKAVKSSKFAYLTWFLSDALDILTTLCLSFQRSDLNIADVGPLVVSCRQSIKSLKTRPGAHLESLLGGYNETEGMLSVVQGEHTIALPLSERQVLSLHSTANQFLQSVCDNLSARFPDMEIVDALAIFDPRNLPAPGTEALDTFGLDAVGTLVCHFRDMEDPGGSILLRPAQVQCEWRICRSLMSTSYRDKTLEEFATEFCRRHAPTLGQIWILLAIAATLPASTAGCERGFSTQNRLKTKLRNRLPEGKLELLMRLSI